MRITDSPEEAAWRAEVREFLEKELPENLRNANRGVRARVRGADLATDRAAAAHRR